MERAAIRQSDLAARLCFFACTESPFCGPSPNTPGKMAPSGTSGNFYEQKPHSPKMTPHGLGKGTKKAMPACFSRFFRIFIVG